MSKEQKLKDKIEKLSEDQEWNHQYTLEGNIKTRKVDINSPGYNTNKWPRIEKIIQNYCADEKTFLDVGCSDGYYAIELAKLNKNYQVTGLDIDSLRIKRSNFMKNHLKIDNANFIEQDLYDLIKANNKFDVVLGLGLLHRVPDIDKCIFDLCSISQKFIIFEFKSLKTEKDDILRHQEKTKSNEFNKLYGTPSNLYVVNKMKESGFKCVLIDDDTSSSLNYPRSIILGEKNV